MLFLLATSGAVYIIMRHNWATASGPKLPQELCYFFLMSHVDDKYPKQLSWERYFIIHQTWDCLTQCLEDASFRKRQDGGIAIAHPQSRSI